MENYVPLTCVSDVGEEVRREAWPPHMGGSRNFRTGGGGGHANAEGAQQMKIRVPNKRFPGI